MANGAYYMVTRIMTNAWMWGHSSSDVYKKWIHCYMKMFPEDYFANNPAEKWLPGNRPDQPHAPRRHPALPDFFVTPFEILFSRSAAPATMCRAEKKPTGFSTVSSFASTKPDPSRTVGNGLARRKEVSALNSRMNLTGAMTDPGSMMQKTRLPARITA